MKSSSIILTLCAALGADPSCGVNRNRLSLAPSAIDALAVGMVSAKDVRCAGGDVAGYTNTLVRKNLSTRSGGITIESTGWYMVTHGWTIIPEKDGVIASYVYASEMPTPVRLVQDVKAGAMDAGSASALYLAQAGERLHVVCRSSTGFTVREGMIAAVQQFD